MNYAEIKNYDIANGPGVRVSVFVSGCTHRCKDCFNSVAWDFRYGREFNDDVCDDIIKMCEPQFISGLTVLGGEPFEPENQPEVAKLLKVFKNRYPPKNIWIFSGYTYEELTGKIDSRARGEFTDEILNTADVLVDGKFESDKKDLMLKFRGSSNQRLIDLKKTRSENKIIIL